MARVTMADVALEAGVNKGTVSRALRGDRRISAETRGRVWETAKKLGYELDAVASGLSSRRTGVAAVVLERMDAPWTGEFLSAAAGVLSRCKMELLLFEGGSASLAANVLRRIEGRKADGLIWFRRPGAGTRRSGNPRGVHRGEFPRRPIQRGAGARERFGADPRAGGTSSRALPRRSGGRDGIPVETGN